MGLLAFGATDTGQKRKNNQDAIYLDIKRNLFVVADGMGGHKGGDIASKIAVEAIGRYVMDNYDEAPLELQKSAIENANFLIKKESDRNQELAGMGTTVVSMLFKGPNLYLANIGDSRCYLINNKQLFQLSKDHSLVQEKLNLDIYTRKEANNDPQKNVIVRTVGFDESVEVDLFTYKVHRNDIFLSCSDGLHSVVSDSDIIYLINQIIPDPSQTKPYQVKKLTETLVKQANDNGGFDNISVMVVVAT